LVEDQVKVEVLPSKTETGSADKLTIVGVGVVGVGVLPPHNGGAKRDRTVDLLAASEALSQLSYSPKLIIISLYECYELFFYFIFHKNIHNSNCKF